MKIADIVFLVFFIFMSILAVCFTIRDKAAAKTDPRNRTPEATLMLIAALFGSFAMYVTMQIIRHKTKHAKFMIGIPVMMVVHAALIVLYFVLLRPILV